MTGSREWRLGRALTTLSWWVLGGVLVVLVGVATWFFVAVHDSGERGRRFAEEDARMVMAGVVEDLRAAIADGELTDADVASVDSSSNKVLDVSRSPDRVVITARVNGLGPGAVIGGSSVWLCSVYEIPLPITDAVVHQHETDTC
ncbi:hypothetical protein [Saccharothrix deserti]|uniref:hypothetical protein n=1 Tax=Saccharothrix deserti TaxID=2593674 RepID=UPI00131B7457|nr:hypothetical protein [Saccharothrix deserti]